MTDPELHARAVLIGLAEPLERLAGWLDSNKFECDGNASPRKRGVEEVAKDTWSRWCRARAAEARMWGKAEEGK